MVAGACVAAEEAVCEGRLWPELCTPLSRSPRLHASKLHFTTTVACQSVFNTVVKMLAYCNYIKVQTYRKAPIEYLAHST